LTLVTRSTLALKLNFINKSHDNDAYIIYFNMISRHQFYYISLTCHGTVLLLFIVSDYYLFITWNRGQALFLSNFSFDIVNTFSLSFAVIIVLVSFRQSTVIIVARPTIHIFIRTL